MERFWCYLVGFVVALVLVAGFLIVKSVVEDRRENGEHRVKQLAEVVCHEQFRKWTGCHLVDLDKFVDKRIDLKQAEKEGKNETAEL